MECPCERCLIKSVCTTTCNALYLFRRDIVKPELVKISLKYEKRIRVQELYKDIQTITVDFKMRKNEMSM